MAAAIHVLSTDARLLTQLETHLGAIASFVQARSFDELRYHLNDCGEAAVLDFRTPSRGGHLEDRLIDELAARHPLLGLVLLTAEPCPETLERRIACDSMHRFREPPDWHDLAARLQSLLGRHRTDVTLGQPAGAVQPHFGGAAPTLFADRAHAHAITRQHDSCILEGHTRQFETQTPRLRQMLSELEVAAAHDVTILLIGETGSGKTFLSQLIHEISPRARAPFLPVACGALPNELIESELFGHVKGSFTSAHVDKEGKFVAAGRGTILLDEIDVLGLEQQVKLLRVIETGQFEPVGSNTTHTSQARLVVASNLELEPLVAQGRFRPDLYYRLNMLKFEIPPLRQRKADIVPLAQKFIQQMAVRHQVRIERVDESFLERILTYPWPGNVRELENVVQRAVIFCRDGVLTEKHLPGNLLAGLVGPTNDPSIRLAHDPHLSRRLGQQIAMTEQEIIEQALASHNNSRTRAARELGISRVTLYNKMKKYGIPNKS